MHKINNYRTVGN